MGHFLFLLVLALFGTVLGAPSIAKSNVTNSIESEQDSYGLNGRILGGASALMGQFPYMVSLRRVNGGHFCGGSIINNHWVLTAAHCLQGKSAGQIVAVVGTNWLAGQGEFFNAAQLIIHPSFNGDVMNADIGLIKVHGSIRYNKLITPIPLPPYNLDQTNHPAVITGWGAVREGGSAPNDLQYLNTRLLSLHDCRQNDGRIKEWHICSKAGPGQSNCFGDSGSPLVSNGFQVGIVSFGYGCGKGAPDVYARVFYHVGWIRHHTG